MPVVIENGGLTARFVRSLEKHGYDLEPSRRVHGIGPATGDISIAFIGEAPGESEVEAGEPFVGKAGKMLHYGLTQAEIFRPSVWITNVITVRPPKNKIDSIEAKEAIECQMPGFWEEIEYLVHERHVKVLVPLGGTALAALNIPGSIMKVRGSVYEYDLTWKRITTGPSTELCSVCDVLVMPTFHPSFVMRGGEDGEERSFRFGSKTDNGTLDNKLVFIEDLKKAKKVASEPWKRPKENFVLKPTLTDLVRFKYKVIKEKPLLSVDIETTSLNRYSGKIVMIGFATDGENAFCVPLLTKGGEHYWPEEIEPTVKNIVSDILSNCPQMYQNALFDVPYLRLHGFNVNLSLIEHDPMIAHHTLSPEMKHDIGFISSIYGITPYWKEDFLSRSKTILEMDQIEVRTYNARDCVVPHQIMPPLIEDLKEKGLYGFYKEEPIAMIPSTVRMMETGVVISKSNERKVRQFLTDRIASTEEELRRIGNLPDGFDLNSDVDMRLFLFGIVPNKYKKAKEELSKKTKTDTIVYKNLKTVIDVVENTKPIWIPYGLKPRMTKTGQIQVDKQNRLRLQIAAQNRLAEIKKFVRPTAAHKEEQEKIERLLSWLSKYNRYASDTTIKNTFTDFKVEADGRLHTRFLITGTATGRLSSREPNLLNIPKKDKEDPDENYVPIRTSFVASPGCLILSADYENLEVKTMAEESDDDTLREIFRSGRKLHDENVKILFGIDKGDPRFALAKRAAKIFFFGRISYGGSDEEIYEKVIIEVPELGLTRAQFKKASEDYFKAHPKLLAWSERVRREARETRKVYTWAGRCRTLLGPDRDIEKEALNTPNQSGAASITNRAQIRIDREIIERCLKSRIQAQVYDQFFLEVPVDEMEIVAELVKRQMEQPVNMYGRQVVFTIDLEVGKSWGELIPYDEWLESRR